ncbi:hypothetical protein IWQ60_001187 [Tieghemiomyces parasiticus]|uniref:Programmed cell death protein 2 C-terminal domain-containing protein n=1 Tax=Tieghemiomyces parasiticus TaxID=78921 RepID=A0A9W8AH63_9FUNG|nr:hypothetical protein IWQ60_001187 [Tieghemiomyces parasiticus]
MAKAKNKRKQTRSPVYLGLPDEASNAQQGNDVYSTAIGGVPTWLNPDCPPPKTAAECDHCGRAMPLLLQNYAPFETSAYDRVLYIWGCNSQQCMGQPGSFKTLRSHCYNREYAEKLQRIPAKPTATPVIPAQPKSVVANPAFALGDLWGTGFKKPVTIAPSTPALTTPSAVPPNDTPVDQLTEGLARVGVSDNLTMVPSDSDSDASENDDDNGEDASYLRHASQVSSNAKIQVRTASGTPVPLSNPTYVSTSTALDTALRSRSNAIDSGVSQNDALVASSHLPGLYLYATEEVLENPVPSPSTHDLPSDLSRYAVEMREAASLASALTQGDTTSQDTSYSRKGARRAEAAGNSSDSGGAGGESWAGEQYERDALPSGMDRGLQRFTERVSEWPDQCLRYDLGGVPLLYSQRDVVARTLLTCTVPVASPMGWAPIPRYQTVTAAGVPPCPYCQAPRVFECQLMPNTLLMLHTEKHAERVKGGGSLAAIKMKAATTVSKAHGDGATGPVLPAELPGGFDTHGMEWGTVIVYVCGRDCHGGVGADNTTDAYYQECVYVQLETM